MKREVTVGIIGAGGIADYVHIPGFKSCPDARIAVVCDSDIASARTLAEKHGIERVCADYREVLVDKEIDGVVIATPNAYHAHIAAEALSAGKHVLLEKPMAMNTSEAVRLYRLAEKSKLVNMVAFNYRFVPAIRYLKHLIAEGELGTIYHVRAFYLQQWPLEGNWIWRCDKSIAGTGHLGDLGSHLVDFARFLVGEFRAVFGSLTVLVPTRMDPATGKQRTCDADDAAQFIARFTNGASGVFDMTRYAPGRGCKSGYQFLEINGSRGSAIYEFQAPEEDDSPDIPHDGDSLSLCLGPKESVAGVFRRVKVPEAFLKVPFSSRALPAKLPLVEPRYDQAQTFVHGIRTGSQVSPSFYDGLRAVQVIEAVERSSATRVEVPIEQIAP